MDFNRLKATNYVGRRDCCTLEALPDRLKARYRRLALIVTRSQLDLLDSSDEDTLVICCDWLMWQEEIAAGRHIAYYELGIRDWDEPDTLNTDLHLRANDWIPKEGNGDPTVFRNVSLGRLFGAEISNCLINFYRLDRALRKLIERFRPEEIWFFDFIFDLNILSVPLRKSLVNDILRDCGIAFVDRSGEAPSEGGFVAEAAYAKESHGPAAQAILTIYAWLLETATRIRCLASVRDRRVLVLVNSNMAAPLVRNFSGEGLTPVFVGRTIPRQIGLLWHCLRRGILLVAHRASHLSREDLNRLGEIRRSLEWVLSTPAEGDINFVRAYVRQEILDTGRMEEMAKQVTMAERLLDSIRPKRIVADGVRMPPPRIFIELALIRNIAVDYIWHSTHSPQSHKVDALGGDSCYARRVTRCLSWGRINEKWLNQVEGPLSRVRVGSPLRDKYVGKTWWHRSEANAPSHQNVLLLHYAFILQDLVCLNTSMFENFVSTVRELRRLGYANVRFKLHPGYGPLVRPYFESIARFFDLDCPILEREPFHECVAWADIVLGPVQSGALFETLASGKPYYAFMLAPHSMDASYFEGFPLITALDQLPQALSRDLQAAGRRLLDDVYSVDSIPNPSKRFWEVLAADAE